MRRLWSRWLDWLARTEPGTAFALFRIAVGLCVLLTIGSVVVYELVDVLWVGSDHGGVRKLARPGWLIGALGGATPTVTWGVTAASLVGGVLLTLGVGGRVATLVTLQLVNALVDLNGHAGGSYDELLSNALWLLFLGGGDQTLSVRCRRRTGAWHDPTPMAAWPRSLVVYQLVLAYGSTGLQKLSAHWTPVGGYSALYYILQQPSWHRRDMRWIAELYPLTQVATAVTWFWEVGAPLLLLALYFRRTADRPGRVRAVFNRVPVRTVFVGIGVPLHLGVFLLMDVGPFTWVTLAFYVCLFSSEEWEGALRRVRGGR